MGNRIGIQRTKSRRILRRQSPANADRARPSLLERRIIEIRVRLRIEQLVRENRWFGEIDGQRPNPAVANSLQHRFQSVDVHCLMKAVVQGFFDQRMVGRLNVHRADVVLARQLVRKYGGNQIIGAGALNLRRHSSATVVAKHRQGAGRIPAEASTKQRRLENRLNQSLFHVLRRDKFKDVREGKAVLLPE